MSNTIFIFILAIIILGIFIYFFCNSSENFQLDQYLRPNYQSGVNMLRGDLDLAKTRQSWFNTKYGPSSLTPGFFKPF